MPRSCSCSSARAIRASIRAKGETLEVVQDRLRFAGSERARVIEALEAALRVGQGRVNVHVGDDPTTPSASPPPLLVEEGKKALPSSPSLRGGAPPLAGGVVRTGAG